MNVPSNYKLLTCHIQKKTAKNVFSGTVTSQEKTYLVQMENSVIKVKVFSTRLHIDIQKCKNISDVYLKNMTPKPKWKTYKNTRCRDKSYQLQEKLYFLYTSVINLQESAKIPKLTNCH